MTFNEWYEANKEGLTTHSSQSALREAWNAGFRAGFKEYREIGEIAELSLGGGMADA